MKPIHAKVTVYKKFLIVEYQTTTSDDIVTSPIDNPNSFGYVIADTNYVGMSKEAYDAIKMMKRSNDSIADMSIFPLSNGLHAFATLGGQYCMMDIEEAETCRDTRLPPIENFQIIENISPEGAVAVIDEEE